MVSGEEKGHLAGKKFLGRGGAGICPILRDGNAELRHQMFLTRISISKSVEQERGTS